MPSAFRGCACLVLLPASDRSICPPTHMFACCCISCVLSLLPAPSAALGFRAAAAISAPKALLVGAACCGLSTAGASSSVLACCCGGGAAAACWSLPATCFVLVSSSWSRTEHSCVGACQRPRRGEVGGATQSTTNLQSFSIWFGLLVAAAGQRLEERIQWPSLAAHGVWCCWVCSRGVLGVESCTVLCLSWMG